MADAKPAGAAGIARLEKEIDALRQRLDARDEQVIELSKDRVQVNTVLTKLDNCWQVHEHWLHGHAHRLDALEAGGRVTRARRWAWRLATAPFRAAWRVLTFPFRLRLHVAR